MKDELVSFETAKIAKEKGFDAEDRTGMMFFTEGNKNSLLRDTGSLADGYSEIFYEEGDLLCPTQSLLQRWLREKFNIHIDVHAASYAWNNKNSYYRSVYKVRGKHLSNEYHSYRIKDVDSYESCLEQGLQEALRLI